MMANGREPRPLNENERYRMDRTYEALFHEDRIIGEIRVFCLKAVLVLNGAASIALISMHGIIADTEGIGRALTGAGYFFLGGLIAAGTAAGFVYSDHRCFRRIIQDDLSRLRHKKIPRSRSYSLIVPLTRIGICLCVTSFGLFIWGGVSILIALEKLVGSGATGS